MRSLRSSSLLLVLAVTCCTRPPADQLKTELQAVASWAATARMTGEAWAQGSVPRAYAAHTLRTAREALQEETGTIGEPAQGGGELQASLAARTEKVAQVIEGMRATVERDDKQALTQLLEQLKAEEREMKALAASGGVQP
ncbi:MAG TPA: hypothetical protein VJT09_07880 [Pyrinomonadaceae bacterium]|nr:hypothetical protein [Pyrinomonadaceae bacterium]